MEKKITLHVSGMHCHSCEMMIESSIKKVAHVEKVQASTRKQRVDISYKEEINLNEIQEKIEALGYKIVEESDEQSKDTVPFFNKDPKTYTTLFLIII
jgi:Cu+-exporting ATPase